MDKGKLRVLLFEFFLILCNSFILLSSNKFDRTFYAVFIFCFALVSVVLFKKNKKKKEGNQAIMLMLTLSILYILLIYGLGFVFGFVKSKYSYSPALSFENVTIPLIITIIFSEVIRCNLYNQQVRIRYKKWTIDLSKIFLFIAFVLMDIVITLEIYSFTNLEESLIFFGLVLFPSISSNILFNYITQEYSSFGIISYRIISMLYPLYMQIIPDIHLLILSVVNMVFPYFTYIVFDFFFQKRKVYVSKQKEKHGFILNFVTIVGVVGIMMLVSNQFKYKALVISTYSMTGTIDKGDVIVYEEYKNQYIEDGDIIVFDYNGLTTIHRVIDIENINGQIRYYTKGDANARPDDGYRLDSDIDGVLNFKVKYIGYPTLWLRDIFK